jgi:hypothetical protein
MDDFAARICGQVVVAWQDFEAGRTTLMDLSHSVQQAGDALDNQYAPLPELLRRTASDLEYAYFSTESDSALDAGQRIMDPVLPKLVN